MKKQITRAVKKAFPSLAAYFTLIANKDSFLYTSGWIESVKSGYPCRLDGSELPWMNYSVIAFLEKRLCRDLTLFEYGSGYSTPFYARRVRTVTSVEHDKFWYDLIKSRIPDNVRLIYAELDQDGSYCRSIAQNNEQYDVVIIDGRDRVNCIKQSLDCLSPQGVILMDDSHRNKYMEGLQYARERGFCHLDFAGLKPTGNGIDQTTLLYRRANCFGI